MPPPGKKLESYQKRYNAKFSDARRAWLDLPRLKLSLFVNEETEDDTESVTIQIALFGRNLPFRIGLGGMTQAELSATKEFFDLAWANALPIVKRRDQEAQEEFDEGDTSNSRIYRVVPRVFVREGPLFRDRPSLLRGSAWVDELESAIISVTTKLRVGRSTVPEPDPDTGGTKNYPSPPSIVPPVRGMAGPAVDLDGLQGTEGS